MKNIYIFSTYCLIAVLLVFAGNQAGSPMPPRPPSNQVDGQSHMTSTMATPGEQVMHLY